MFKRKLKSIKNLILENGGGTFNSKLKDPAFKRGYMVSQAGTELKLDIENLKIKTIKKYAKIAQKQHAYVGFWLDSNILYIDISKHFISKNRACKYALKNKQLAIYDLYNKKSIYSNEFYYTSIKKRVLTF